MSKKEHRNPNRSRVLDLSPDEALEGARIAARNARDLLEFAVTGTQCHRFGPAIALCVLASEEGAKALALFQNAINPEDGTLLREVFSRHKTKHSLSGMSVLLIHIGELMYRFKDEIQSEIDRGIATEQRPGTRWVNRVAEELKRLTRAKDDQSTRFITWYSTADRLKMSGFYVDRATDTGWHDPNNLTESAFLEYRSYVERWLDIVDFLLTLPLREVREKMRELRNLTLR